MKARFYYELKPFIPWRLRIALRRAASSKLLASSRAVWPILPSAADPPAGWPGWPEGKKFAFVLTHDVEGIDGLAKCRPLAQLESKLGFRSSFNFIPEGGYFTPPEFRSWLAEQGFEVGIHDLNHDGRLYLSREIFRRNAQRINSYARDWGASGFRSGFMLHELDWIHDLDIAYDASTFDTDPFEPQPDGVGTIFPFWIPTPEPGSPRPGYVELPYTLPQDSTLFLILREKTPDIWIRKLDWVAEHGGMALINVHPDYLRIDGERPSARTFPIAHYRRLLEYVRERYAGAYWQPLPKELAAWYGGARCGPGKAAVPSQPAPEQPSPLRGKKAAVLLYSYFPSDPRPYRAAQAMVQEGMTVDLLCLTETKDEPQQEVVAGINVYRVPITHPRGSMGSYLWNYGLFLSACFTFLARRNLFRRKYDVVHVHNMPDFLVFAALVPKLRGARIILDLHDPMPELMMTIYNLDSGHWFVRFLRWLEWASTGFADLVLTPNIAFKRLFSSRSCSAEKIRIVMNTPQEDIFRPGHPGPNGSSEPRREFRIMHHGSIVHRHGVDQLVEAVAQVRGKIPGIRLEIYGSPTAFVGTVLATARKLGIDDIVDYQGGKTQGEIAEAILRSDLGVIPNRRSVFTEINFPTRIFEYLAMGCPAIATDTEGIRDYFTPEQLVLFDPDKAGDLAAKILWVWENPKEARAMAHRGLDVYRGNPWSRERARFIKDVAALVHSAT